MGDPSPEGPLSFALRAAGERLGMSRYVFAGMAYDRLAELYGDEATRATHKVLRAILHHANDTHNRFYASVAAIAEFADLATSTVELQLAFLREKGVIRLIVGDELLDGDGPHKASERGVQRRGRHPVNTYDLSGLFYLLPWRIRKMLADTFRKMVQVLVPAPTPSLQSQIETSGSRSGIEERSSSNLSMAIPDTVPPGDPPWTGPPGRSVSSIGIGKATEKTALPPGPEQRPQKHQTERENPPSGRRVPNPINRGENLGSQKGQEWTESQKAAIDALRGVGLRYIKADGDVPVEIVRTMGADWAIMLVEFHHWNLRRNEKSTPGYLYGTWKNWLDGTRQWDENFIREMNHPNRASSVRIGLPKPEQPPASPPAPKRKPLRLLVKPPEDWLLGISRPTQRDLLGRAFRAIKAETGSEPDPLSIEVRDRARRIWQEENTGKKPPWDK